MKTYDHPVRGSHKSVNPFGKIYYVKEEENTSQIPTESDTTPTIDEQVPITPVTPEGTGKLLKDKPRVFAGVTPEQLEESAKRGGFGVEGETERKDIE